MTEVLVGAENRYIRPLLEESKQEMTIPDKPKSAQQRYKAVAETLGRDTKIVAHRRDSLKTGVDLRLRIQ